MTEAARQDPGSSGGSDDIVELIMADHRRIARLSRAVYDTARHDGRPGPEWMLGHVWQRLADLLVAHIQAEEETWYASVSGAGPQSRARLQDSLADHDGIRGSLGEASALLVGSAPWWHAVNTVIDATTEHRRREERDLLAGYALGLSMSRRRELGRQWNAFMAGWESQASRTDPGR